MTISVMGSQCTCDIFARGARVYDENGQLLPDGKYYLDYHVNAVKDENHRIWFEIRNGQILRIWEQKLHLNK